jgi:hypothetical protein
MHDAYRFQAVGGILRGQALGVWNCPKSDCCDKSKYRAGRAVYLCTSLILLTGGTGLTSVAVAEEQPRAKFFARPSCTVVRYYAAKYTVAAAESWARSKGAS